MQTASNGTRNRSQWMCGGSTFLERKPFSRTTPILANAFHVRDVPYQWQRGRRLT